jgi:hypothetical protein
LEFVKREACAGLAILCAHREWHNPWTTRARGPLLEATDQLWQGISEARQLQPHLITYAKNIFDKPDRHDVSTCADPSQSVPSHQGMRTSLVHQDLSSRCDLMRLGGHRL